MFKKPKRHFRQRKLTDGSDEENSEEHAVINNQSQNGASASNSASSNSNKKKKSGETKVKKPIAAVSFDDEGEDGETFQVKKSSKSRKLVKRLKNEKRYEEEEDTKQGNGKETRGKAASGTSIVLNGDRALDMDLDSDCEPESENKEEEPKHEFRTILERGIIPDANLIHLARKKRAMAREQGDFIPLDDTKKAETTPASTQRLIRDDDNDMDEDDDRVDFTLNAAERERQHMKDTFLAAEHGSDEESDQERDWERQQIKKVVGGRAAADQIPVEPAEEYNSYYSVHPSQTGVSGGYSDYTDRDDLKPLPDTLGIDQIKKSLTERLESLSMVHRVHTQERDNVQSGLAQSKRSTEELENKTSDGQISKLNVKYTFMQQLRSYVRDVLDCFNEKYTRLTELDESLMSLAKIRSEKLCKRRQDDIRDEASDCASISKPTPEPNTPAEKRQHAVKLRRIADREARRTRRRQARQRSEYTKANHDDGLSSDDEESKSDIVKYQTDREKQLAESRTLFDDVVDEFSSVSHILDKFEDWKVNYSSDYNDAYVGLCIPKLLSPLIKLSLLDWNPFQTDCTELASMSWYRCVALFGHKRSASMFDSSDPDNELIPMIVEKVLVPKLTGYVDMVWDPVSTSQTKALTGLLHELVEDYPSLNSSSKNTAILLKAVVHRINTSLDEDTFMPLYTADLIAKHIEARSFLHRQIWHSTKLYKNILRFSGLLSDSKLRNLALDSLLNRYIMLGFQCSGTDNSLRRIKAVTDVLPSQWLKSATGDTVIPELENLCRYMKSCAAAYHSASNRDDLKALLKIFVNIHAHNHAKWMSDEYSLRMPK